MLEAVRLLIWDLDETFWHGTLSEGGVTAIPERSIAAVKALNRRGIMSSICSRNDRESALGVLQAVGLDGEFIFPSIDWSAKGPRVRDIIEQASLRPESVMFIDDNPGARAEVAATVPGIQVADETFVARILADERFSGTPDEALTRLGRYQVIESKATDRRASAMSNEAFLRQSGIKVTIRYDLDDRLDRVVELINRTNQLNYTKVRLPEDVEVAKSILRRQLAQFDIQAGLIGVTDRYGHYGEVGFFMQSSVHQVSADCASRGTLLHFCFSCRTLGMLVEQWTYEFLGRPRLAPVGQVLTDLTTPRRVDWITLVDRLDGPTAEVEPRFQRVTLFGGCEANAVAVYLQAHARELRAYGNYSANGCFLRTASAISAVNMCTVEPDAVRETAATLRLPLARLADDIFAGSPAGSLFVFNCSSGDAGSGSGAHFRHRTSGLALNIEPPGMVGQEFMTNALDTILSHVPADQPDLFQYVTTAFGYINANFDLVRNIPDEIRIGNIRRLIDRVPAGCKIILMADHDHIRTAPDTLLHLAWFTEYAADMRAIAAEFGFCGFLSYSDLIRDGSEIQLHGNHYDREVYLRAADRICEIADGLVPKPAA